MRTFGLLWLVVVVVACGPAAKPPEPAKPTPPIAAADPPAVAPVTPVQQEVLADPAKPAAADAAGIG